MKSRETVLEVDFSHEVETELFLPQPPLVTSYQAGWKSVQLAHFKQNGFDTPEMSSKAHIVVMSNWQESSEVTMVADGKLHLMELEQDQSGAIEIIPADLAFQSRCTKEVEFTQCYFDPAFLSQIAYESIDPDCVDFTLMLQQPDPLLWHMGAALKSALEQNAKNSSFYVDALATAFAAHLLTHYATRKHTLREYNGLPKDRLKQAIEYINAHLSEDLSPADMAAELCMSQYHFSRLFKQSMGMPPHTYLIQQRVKKARQLLGKPELTILDIADQCGFANPSHFAKHFRKHTGVTPRAFRMLTA